MPFFQSLLSSLLLSKNIMIKIHKTIILPVVMYGCETWSSTVMEGRRLRVFEENILTSEGGSEEGRSEKTE
jgi:hypothetical protein